MAHYIDADRLRAELEKPKNELKVGNYYLDNSEQAVGYKNALNDFELLIDSLQQEQPEVESQKIKAWIAREWGPKGGIRMFNFLPKKCPFGYEWEGNSWVINNTIPKLSYTNSPIEVELTISSLNARKEDK